MRSLLVMLAPLALIGCERADKSSDDYIGDNHETLAEEAAATATPSEDLRSAFMPGAQSDDSGPSYVADSTSSSSRSDLVSTVNARRPYADPYEGTEEEPEPFDERAARRAAERKLTEEGYDYSYGCTQDCSGHQAGWKWRAENGYVPVGDSRSFNQGAQAYEDALDSEVRRMRSKHERGY